MLSTNVPSYYESLNVGDMGFTNLEPFQLNYATAQVLRGVVAPQYMDAVSEPFSIRLEFRESSWHLQSLHQLYKSLKELEMREVISLLEAYVESKDVLEYIARTEFLDIRKLAMLVVWINSSLNVNVSSIGIVDDPEMGETQFIAVYLNECGWEEWKVLSKTIKSQLVSEGFSDVAGRVAIVCSQALQIQRG